MAQRKDPKKKIVEAALALAAGREWHTIGMRDIAAEAKMPLGDVRQAFGSKTAILAAFMRDIDRETLNGVEEDPGSGARDRLFDVIMSRLELLDPHKDAMRNIVAGVRRDSSAWPRLAGTALASQRWMLTGAGLEPSGLRGEIRVRGLAAVYWRVMNVWLDDDDAGLARTMSALDRELRRGENWLRRIDGPIMLLGGLRELGRAAMSRAAGPKAAQAG